MADDDDMFDFGGDSDNAGFDFGDDEAPVSDGPASDGGGDTPPKKFSVAKISVVIAVGLIALLIAVLLIRNTTASVETTKDGKPSQSASPVAEKTPGGITESQAAEESAAAEGNSKASEPVQEGSEPAQEATPEASKDAQAKERGTAEESAPAPAEAPAEKKVNPSNVGGSFTASGFVEEKYAVVKNGQYQYVIKLALTRGGGESRAIEYYTTRTGFDSVNIGNVLTVTYGADKDGNISVTNISKK